MSTPKKIGYFLLALSPIPFFGMYIYSFFTMFSNLDYLENANLPPSDFMQNFGMIFTYIIIAMILTLVGMIIYVLDVVKNKKFQGEQSSLKIVWLLVVILMGMIGMIVYFFVEIMGRKEGEDYEVPPITERTN